MMHAYLQPTCCDLVYIYIFMTRVFHKEESVGLHLCTPCLPSLIYSDQSVQPAMCGFLHFQWHLSKHNNIYSKETKGHEIVKQLR